MLFRSELLLPLTLRWAEQAGIPLTRALGAITHQPAAVLGLAVGRIAPGMAADLCVFDARAARQISATSLVSQGKNTPFIGHELQGVVKHTLVDGKSVYAA